MIKTEFEKLVLFFSVDFNPIDIFNEKAWYKKCLS